MDALMHCDRGGFSGASADDAVTNGRPFPRSAHKSNAAPQHYHLVPIGPFTHPSKPDISPDERWRVPMKKIILAAFAVLSLTAAVAPLASAAVPSGPYDNTANSLGGRWVGGGG
jgi:hypothetical protein